MKAILALLVMQAPPDHLLLGSDAVTLVRAKLEAMLENISRHEALYRSTDMA